MAVSINRAKVHVSPMCSCGMLLPPSMNDPFPRPGDPPVVLTCDGCNLQWEAAYDLDWYVSKILEERIRDGRLL